MSYSIKALSRLKATAKGEPYGRSLPSNRVLPEVVEALTALLGPFKAQTFKVVPSKFSTQVLAGKLGMGKKVYALMNDFDFTPVKNDLTGYYGGFRPESNRVSTTINYCEKSGVLVITTNLDVIDV